MKFKLQEKVDSRNKLVNFRATESEIKFIKEEAAKKGMTVSNFIRMMINKGMKDLWLKRENREFMKGVKQMIWRKKKKWLKNIIGWN